MKFEEITKIILQKTKRLQSGECLQPHDFPEFGNDLICFHVRRASDLGLIEAVFGDKIGAGGSYDFLIRGLTPLGRIAI